jgi:hypothetical protein
VNTPEEVLAAAFQALNFDDWAGFTDLCDPVSLRALKTETLHFHSDEDDDEPPYHIDADTILDRSPTRENPAAQRPFAAFHPA